MLQRRSKSILSLIVFVENLVIDELMCINTKCTLTVTQCAILLPYTYYGLYCYKYNVEI